MSHVTTLYIYKREFTVASVGLCSAIIIFKGKTVIHKKTL